MSGGIALRGVGATDRERMFAWRNDPFIVAKGSSQRAVTREEHDQWFSASLENPARRIFIVESGGHAIGQVRFDRDGERVAVISVYLLEKHTGAGRGVAAIRRGCRAIFGEWPVAEVRADVRGENVAAQSAFKKAGFRERARDASTLAEHVTLVIDRAQQTWSDDDERTASKFDALVSEHGVDYKALDWGSRASQEARFKVLAEVGEVSGATLLDVGCGLGDLHAWLVAQGKSVGYTGLDVAPKMVEAARKRFPGITFECGSIGLSPAALSARYDFVVASGIFFLRQAEPTTYLGAAVERMFACANRAVAFNSLSSWASSQDEGEYYADPAEILAVCRRISPWVVLRHDYHPADFTIYLYRERQS